jgi:serine/threonine-protein phosphatase 6 regulatory ankyrin repeat subunit B
MLASQEGRQQVTQVLLDAKADVNTKSKEGITVLMIALQNGHQEVIQLLKEADAKK